MSVLDVSRPSREEELAIELQAARIDLAAARRINDNQRRDVERLQEQVRRLKERRGGWGDR